MPNFVGIELIVRDFFYFVTWNLKWRRIPSFSSKSIRHVVFFNFGGCVALWAMLCVEETSKMTYCVRVSGPFVQTKPNFLATDKNNGTTLLGSADTMRRSHYSSVSRVCASHFAYSTIAGCQVPIFSSFLTFLLFSPIFSKKSYFFLFWGSFTWYIETTWSMEIEINKLYKKLKLVCHKDIMKPFYIIFLWNSCPDFLSAWYGVQGILGCSCASAILKWGSSGEVSNSIQFHPLCFRTIVVYLYVILLITVVSVFL